MALIKTFSWAVEKKTPRLGGYIDCGDLGRVFKTQSCQSRRCCLKRAIHHSIAVDVSKHGMYRCVKLNLIAM